MTATKQIDGKQVAEHNNREKVSCTSRQCRLIGQGVWIVVHGMCTAKWGLSRI
jgi:hypothetical protein